MGGPPAEAPIHARRRLGHRVRAWIYNQAIRPLTGGWYREVLERVPRSSHLLDVGIGTGGALLANADLVLKKDVRVTGVDIDADYIKAARKAILRSPVADRVDVRLESVYDHAGGPYDAIYFAASFMLMPDPAQALAHVKTLLQPDGRVFFTQTFEERRSMLAEKAKPLLKAVTTIDFGQVTYEQDFLDVVERGGLDVQELTTMGTRGRRTFRLAVAEIR